MIIILDSVLSKDDCNQLIELAKPKLISANVLGEQVPQYRTAMNTWLTEITPVTDDIKQMVSQITHLPIENQELIHIVKYEVGGEYKPHHDAFHTNTSYYDGVIKAGGQRKFSCLFYLNDEFTGGETSFPQKNLIITPKTGRLLAWGNTNDNSTIKKDSLHAGLPVISGEKWIAIVWVRESRFK